MDLLINTNALILGIRNKLLGKESTDIGDAKTLKDLITRNNIHIVQSSGPNYDKSTLEPKGFLYDDIAFFSLAYSNGTKANIGYKSQWKIDKIRAKRNNKEEEEIFDDVKKFARWMTSEKTSTNNLTKTSTYAELKEWLEKNKYFYEEIDQNHLIKDTTYKLLVLADSTTISQYMKMMIPLEEVHEEVLDATNAEQIVAELFHTKTHLKGLPITPEVVRRWDIEEGRINNWKGKRPSRPVNN